MKTKEEILKEHYNHPLSKLEKEWIYNAMEEYALSNSHKHSVMQAEASAGAEGAAVASSAVGSQTSARDFFCMTGECGKQCEPCKSDERF